MEVREIKDLTLELARTGDRIEQMFQERRIAATQLFGDLMAQPDRGGPGPLIIRVSAVPISQQSIPDITSRPDLWWKGRSFNMMVGEAEQRCDFPASEFAGAPEPRLRSLISDPLDDEAVASRLLRGDGLVEFSLVMRKREPQAPRPNNHRLYVPWVIGLVVGTLAQVHQLRTKLAWDGVQFGLELEILSPPPLNVLWNDRTFSSGGREVKSVLPLLFPRYSIEEGADFDPIIDAIVRDLWNATGRSWTTKCSVPWSELL
jgi:hypothetical protein